MPTPQLRWYQDKLKKDILQSYIEGFKSPLAVSPTGSGKTVLFASIAESAMRKGKQILILAHRVELLRQISGALHSFGVYHGMINPKFKPNYSAPVQVASVQTLARRTIPFVPDLIIIDEAHHSTANQYRKIIEEMFPTAKILGVTATPCRSDGQGLGVNVGGIFDTMIIGPTVAQLIKEGFLVKPKIICPLIGIDLSSVKMVAGDYDKAEIAEVVDKPRITGDAIANYKKHCDGVPTVVFCINVAHAQHVASEFRGAGYSAYSVDGTMDDDTRKNILQGLGNGSVQIVTSCDLIGEGVDIPAIGAVILLRPTMSLSLYLQQVGRALRPFKGKSQAVIIDHVGNVGYRTAEGFVLNHGFPDDERDWNLNTEKKKRKSGKQEARVIIKQCDKCYTIHEPAPQCPACGHVYQVEDKKIEVAEGDLIELSEDEMQRLKKQKKTEQAKARSLEELKEIARQRGYKPGWADNVYKARLAKQGSI